ncbi:hypothetical protein GGF43_001964 [Coemansia sp. RSA 2618]|nr:hypothetical protein GGF43_001964 [Coemansia sp. RSA 2618]
MKWTGAASKPEVAIYPYTPQIIITNSANCNSNILLGYIIVTVSRPTPVKSITVSFSGTYSVGWVEGIGPTRDEYFQHRLFHCERHVLSTKNLVTSKDAEQTLGDAPTFCERDLSAGWEDVALNHSNSSESTINSIDDNHDLEPPSYLEGMGTNTSTLQTISNSFELSAGTHRLEFVFVVPPRMPSTILSHKGGIDYKLSVFMKTKGHLGMRVTIRADTPIQLVNIPTRLAQLQSSLPVNDEATFTRQIEESWWIMARVMSCTTFPEDTIHMSVCLSWPVVCEYNEDISEHLELVAVQMDLCETTIHKSIISGKVLKTETITVATSLNGDSDLLKSNAPNASPPRYESNQPNRRRSDTKQSSTSGNGADDQLAEAIDYADEMREREAEQPNSRIRGMFNETQRQEFRLNVPRQRDMSLAEKSFDGIHIDCRSAPISIGHKLHITLQILDKVTQKIHLVPFHSRVVIIPEVESFLLPAYSSSLQDTRVQ